MLLSNVFIVNANMYCSATTDHAFWLWLFCHSLQHSASSIICRRSLMCKVHQLSIYGYELFGRTLWVGTRLWGNYLIPRVHIPQLFKYHEDIIFWVFDWVDCLYTILFVVSICLCLDWYNRGITNMIVLISHNMAIIHMFTHLLHALWQEPKSFSSMTKQPRPYFFGKKIFIRTSKVFFWQKPSKFMFFTNI